MKFFNRFVCILILLVSVIIQVQQVRAAAIWTVQSNADGAANAANCPGAGCRLRDAIAAASDGDTINFNLALPATITLTSGEMYIAHNITFTGPGSASLTLNGNNLSDIFYIPAGKVISISGMTLAHGKVIGISGGGIFMVGANLTLNDVVLDQNSSENGGAIYSSGNLTITNSKFTGNYANSNGGAIYMDVGTTLTMSGALIQGNKASTSGGGGVVVLSSSTPSTSISTVNLNNVTMDGNSAQNGGGIIISQAANVTISNSTFSNNVAVQNGGGINTYFPGIVDITNVTISDNNADFGAGFYNNGLGGGAGPINMNNVTIATNTAITDGGGIFSQTTEIRLKNSIIASNVTAGANKDCYAVITSQDYNLIDAITINCAITGTTTHNITAVSPMLAPLADNGGPTQTRALQTGSPAIDAANNATCASADQRGTTRPQDGNLDSTAVCDIGAYELDKTSPTVQTITRANASPTNASSVDFTVTFSEPVTGVNAGDFSLTTSGVSSPAVSGVSGSGSVYTVSVNTGTGIGTIRLDLVNDGTIKDIALNPLAAGFTSGDVYTITKSPTFADVPFSYWASNYVERLYSAGITGGCSVTPLNYCPDSTVTRAQMAVFLLKGIHTSSYSPPAVGGSTGFTDVATSYWASAWIKQLSAEGITGGCGAGIYCPDATVTRAQMAVFLLKAKHGSSYSPPNATGVFSDVPVGYWADKWIEQLAVEGVTSGCGAGIYCPDADVTRAQMAVFLVKTFGLP